MSPGPTWKLSFKAGQVNQGTAEQSCCWREQMIKSCRIAFVCWPWLVAVAVAVAGGAPGWPLLPSGNLAKVLPLLLLHLLTLSKDASEVHSFPSLQADGQPAQGRTLHYSSAHHLQHHHLPRWGGR